jgi:hypothetical protein
VNIPKNTNEKTSQLLARMIDPASPLWNYLSAGQKALVAQGYYLLEDLNAHVPIHPITDYSFIVFPVAKAYEGFLKQLFLDLELITVHEYESNHFRIGKVLSPNLMHLLKQKSMYYRLTKLTGNNQLPDRLWNMWKRGRNQIFHYFPHNLSAITYIEAEGLVAEFMETMTYAITVCPPRSKTSVYDTLKV